VKGIEFGAGFAASERKGSDNNDPFVISNGDVTCSSNNAGGILGGISTGLPLIFRTAFKPTPSIAKEQRSVNLDTMEECTLQISGRHDPCIVLRAVPVIEACAALSVLDMLLADERTITIEDCRNRINSIDCAVAELLAERFETTDRIGALKLETGAPVYNPERERAVLKNVASGAGEYQDDVTAVYKEILNRSKERQQRSGD
jgi:Chorismate synthase